MSRTSLPLRRGAPALVTRVTSTQCDLPAIWPSKAAEFRAVGAEGQALVFERSAQELTTWLSAQDERLLRVSEAAALTGRHRDTIGGAINDGRLVNHGVKNRPRVLAADVVKVFPPKGVVPKAGSAYDAGADARSFLALPAGRVRA